MSRSNRTRRGRQEVHARNAATPRMPKAAASGSRFLMRRAYTRFDPHFDIVLEMPATQDHPDLTALGTPYTSFPRLYTE